MSNFAFIKAEWPELHDAATKAEGLVYPDARGSVLLYPARAGAGCSVALPTRSHAHTTLSGPPECAHPRAQLPAGSRSSSFHQGEAPQGPGQSGRA
jgi:hypothetical protein